MCGINGFISTQHSQQDRETIVRNMNDRLKHRGPNNDGIFSDKNITFGHRRLSIIDLSENANQPFFSQDNKLVIVFNGEIDNYRELKLELQRAAQGSGHSTYFFKTNSDTEVILAAYLRWGNQCLNYLNGMFAFAIYNTETGNVFAATATEWE